MRLDQATFAFGFTIKNSAGNPNWGTSLGQGREHKINSFTDAEEILKGMVYSSVSLDRIELRIGKGGALRKGKDNRRLIKAIVERCGNLRCFIDYVQL